MPNISKYFFSTFISFLLFSGIIFSQSFIYPDSLEGKYALQFQIGSNFQLKDFQGTTFSGKYHIGKREALRLGVSLTSDIWDGEGKEEYFDNDSVVVKKRDGNYFTINVKFQYIRYLISDKEISFYCGSGPYLFFENNVRNDDENSGDRNYLGIGLNLLAGVEWMFNKNMSLSAEYGIRFLYVTYDDTTTYHSRKEIDSSDRFIINADNVNFGISVYF